jgi:hypothetical protein
MDDLKKHEIIIYSLKLFAYLFFYPIILYNLGFILLPIIDRLRAFDNMLAIGG